MEEVEAKNGTLRGRTDEIRKGNEPDPTNIKLDIPNFCFALNL